MKCAFTPHITYALIIIEHYSIHAILELPIPNYQPRIQFWKLRFPNYKLEITKDNSIELKKITNLYSFMEFYHIAHTRANFGKAKNVPMCASCVNELHIFRNTLTWYVIWWAPFLSKIYFQASNGHYASLIYSETDSSLPITKATG